MKRLLATAAFALLTFPSFAAIQYDFTQKNTTDDAVSPSTDVSARALIDGQRSRIEFLSGNLYPPGTYVLSNDGARRLFFVDPTNKWYTEVDAAGIASALGSSTIKIDNLSSKLDPMPDKLTIAGIEAQHSRITLNYDITVTLKSMPLKQHVQTDIDLWTTSRFASVQHTFANSSIRTGNADLDNLLDAETSKIQGFPLRQLVTIRTNYDLPMKSNLNRPTTRTLTRETWVTAVREVEAQPASFVLPPTYRRADTPEMPRSATQILNFEPAGTK